MIKHLLPLVILFFVGCSRTENELLSSDKSISSVTFQRADNPGLMADISGSISADTITFEFPSNVAINSLTPTIDFKGKLIEPANRTQQDFTNGKRYTITAEDGSTHNYFFAVRQISTDTTILVLGTWKLIKDSAANNNWINPAGGDLVPGVYIGTPEDYWQFDSNGVFSARENNISGADTYSILPDRKLYIPVWSVQYGSATIETLTNTEFTIYFSATSNNGGAYFRKVYLKR
jgi:hypothetical protein